MKTKAYRIAREAPAVLDIWSNVSLKARLSALMKIHKDFHGDLQYTSQSGIENAFYCNKKCTNDFLLPEYYGKKPSNHEVVYAGNWCSLSVSWPPELIPVVVCDPQKTSIYTISAVRSWNATSFSFYDSDKKKWRASRWFSGDAAWLYLPSKMQEIYSVHGDVLIEDCTLPDDIKELMLRAENNS